MSAKTQRETSKPPWAVAPLDFSFKEISSEDDILKCKPRKNRLGSVPQCGQDNKYNTTAVWLNNNKLQTTRDGTAIVNLLLAAPNSLLWLDLSYNKIYDIDEHILQFKKLKILYLHSNVIYNLEVVTLLQQLPELHTLTLHGNPVETLPQYRKTVLRLLPRLASLDFVRVMRSERVGIPTQCHLDIIRSKKK